jgi:valyl-tRNA synthetase
MKLKHKTWTKEMEKPVYEEWKEKKKYRFVNDGRPIFSIDTPPPYVNTPVHIGHAATYTLMDMFARFHRMIGDNVLFPLGLDRNGLPIEMAAEKRFGISLVDVSRKEFIELCKKMLEESSAESIDSFMKLGHSYNSWTIGTGVGDIYLTDSDDYRSLTQSTFIDLWNRGLIYEDKRINNFCPGCKTTLADAEVEYEERPTVFNEIKFHVANGKDIIIATTRPELICTCAMIIYHPDDERYKDLNGKTVVTPLFGKRVPIMPHPMADPEKGTGIVMMCSAGDQHDIQFFREMNLKPVIAIDADGHMNKNAGFLAGLTVSEAREKMIEKLKENNLLVSQKKLNHRTPTCERSGHEIEFIEMSEFYLKQTEFKEEMKKIAEKTNFYSPKSRQILLDWINSVSIDWPISRRRYYATEIPLWHCTKCSYVFVPPKGTYYKPWQESPPVKECPKCGSAHFRGEERVFDTWFDSANSPLYILQYEKDSDFFSRNFPCILRPQGKEIVRTWLYYTLLKGYLLLDKPVFRDVWIHHHIVDESGKKMSKSVGNILDPHDILERFGAEPFRLWCALEGNLEKDDMRCSFERIEGTTKTLTKLWNIANFVSQFDLDILVKKEKTGPTVEAEELDPDILDITLSDLDKWIISELNGIVKHAREQYQIYDFHNPAVMIRHFMWETFASHYLELAKNRAYNQHKLFNEAEQRSAVFTLHYCLNTLLKLLAPITPFITHILYSELYDKDVHVEKFPMHKMMEETSITKDDIFELNNTIWKAKKDNSMSLKAEIRELVLPEKFACIEKDIAATHNAQKITYGKKIEVKI